MCVCVEYIYIATRNIVLNKLYTCTYIHTCMHTYIRA